MKINYKNICLLFMMITLSACPYKEVYKAVNQINSTSSVKISPVMLFFSSHQKLATCDVIYKIINPTDSVKQTNFAESFLINKDDTLKIAKIFPAHYEINIPIQSTFNIYSQQDTLIAFRFKDLKQKFGDTLKVIIDMSGVGKSTFIYKKVK